MSTFAVPIKRIRAIEPHPNAEAIEFAVIDGYRSIVKKGEFSVGDLVAYIPEAALLPEWLLKRMGFWDAEKGCGKLNGKEGNRVKAIRLRGDLSEGICYPVDPATLHDFDADREVEDGFVLHVDHRIAGVFGFIVREGDDAAEMLGITKYEPPIPVSMAGEVFNAGTEATLSFDMESWKSYPCILQDGEQVIFTEKLHGSFTAVTILPYRDAHPEAFGEKRNILVFSKGLGAKGLAFKNNERNRDNLYVRSTRALIARIDEIQRGNEEGVPVPYFILGETYGPGVQDLAYGRALGFRVFAAAYGYRGDQHYKDWAFVEGEIKDELGCETVPVLYRGPFSEAIMQEYTDGKTALDAAHIREGIVMVPAIERHDPAIGRVCLKSVSADYLTRKGGTEFN